MPADLIHLVRHGEVYNPEHVVYERIPGFHLSELGHRMAQAAADSFAGRDIVRLVASPLQRTQESAAPWAERFGLSIETDERIIEPTNRFAGSRVWPDVLKQPQRWPWLANPARPSWGEPFASVIARMSAAVTDAWRSVDHGEVVLVSHQLPIWLVHRAVNGQPLAHDPKRRRCALSSITTLTRASGTRTGFAETAYGDPAAPLLAEAVDAGAT